MFKSLPSFFRVVVVVVEITDGRGFVRCVCVCETTMIQATFFMRRLLLLNRIRRRQLALPNNFACTISPFF